MCPSQDNDLKYWDKKVCESSIDPDRTAPRRSSLFRVYTVCYFANIFSGGILKYPGIYKSALSYFMTNIVIGQDASLLWVLMLFSCTQISVFR